MPPDAKTQPRKEKEIGTLSLSPGLMGAGKS